MNNDLQKEAKKLAIDLEHPINELIKEALRDLLKKYKNKSKYKVSRGVCTDIQNPISKNERRGVVLLGIIYAQKIFVSWGFSTYPNLGDIRFVV